MHPLTKYEGQDIGDRQAEQVIVGDGVHVGVARDDDARANIPGDPSEEQEAVGEGQGPHRVQVLPPGPQDQRQELLHVHGGDVLQTVGVDGGVEVKSQFPVRADVDGHPEDGAYRVLHPQERESNQVRPITHWDEKET